MNTAPEREHGIGFWLGFVIGGGIIAFGIHSVLQHSAATKPRSMLIWIVGADVIHDAILVPLVILIGVLLVRFVREQWRTPLRAGLLLSALVCFIGWIPWRGYGRDTVPDNPTVQPLDYTTAILTSLAVVWLSIALWMLVRIVRARRRARAQ
jgi:hypothetical protein